MAEYIEREANGKSICRSCFHSYVCEQFNEHRDGNNEKCHFFNDHFVSAADVVEVRRGEWVDNHNGTFTCSVCGGQSSKMDYCGRCGSKMDGKGEGE